MQYCPSKPRGFSTSATDSEPSLPVFHIYTLGGHLQRLDGVSPSSSPRKRNLCAEVDAVSLPGTHQATNNAQTVHAWGIYISYMHE